MEVEENKSLRERGRLVVISGASAGAGKDTVVKLFLDRHPEWCNPPSTTTREPRPGETEGVDYYFTDRLTFKQKLSTGKFLEADFHAGNWYGTLSDPIDKLLSSKKNVIVRKDVNGALEIKKKMPEAVVVFIDVESPEVLEHRIRGRQSENEDQIQYRLELAKKEQEFKKHFDYVVINYHNRIDEAVDTVERARKS
jgi:guanylate kinase